MAVVGIGFIEMLLVSLMGLPMHQLVGLPPGERDLNMARMASAESIVFFEWASRGEGKPGADGIDGMAAEPEIINFFQSIQTAIQTSLVKESGIADLKILPELAVHLSGHPGSVFLEVDTDAEIQPGPPMLSILQTVRGGIIINTGDDSAEIEGKIAKLASMAFRSEVEKLDHLVVPAPIPIEIHQHEGYLILGVGEDVVNQIVERLKSGNAGLANNASFQKASKDVTVNRVGSVVFIDAEKLLAQIQRLTNADPTVQAATTFSGLDKMQWAMMVGGADESGRIVSRVKLMGLTFDEGLLAGIANAKIKTTDLSVVPSDSDLVFGASFDVLAIKDAIITLLPPQVQQEADGGFEQFGGMLGLDWEKDVFDVFDNAYVLSNSPGDGGWILSAPVISVAIKDHEAAKKSLQKFARAMRRNLPQVQDRGWRRRGMTLEEQEYDGKMIYMINTVGDDVPMAPSWCITDTHLMFSLHPQPLRSRLHRMSAENWSPISPKFDDLSEGDVIGFSNMKSASLMRQLYGFGPWIGQLFYSQLQSEGIDLTLLDFPSAAAVLPHMYDSRSYAVKTAEGIEFFTEGPPLVSSLPAIAPSIVPFMFLARVQHNEVIMMEADAVEFEAVEALEAVEAVEAVEQ